MHKKFIKLTIKYLSAVFSYLYSLLLLVVAVVVFCICKIAIPFFNINISTATTIIIALPSQRQFPCHCCQVAVHRDVSFD